MIYPPQEKIIRCRELIAVRTWKRFARVVDEIYDVSVGTGAAGVGVGITLQHVESRCIVVDIVGHHLLLAGRNTFYYAIFS